MPDDTLPRTLRADRAAVKPRPCWRPTPPLPAPRCNPELVEVLQRLRYPAWIETDTGELIFSNGLLEKKSEINEGPADALSAAIGSENRQIWTAGRPNEDGTAWSRAVFPVYCDMGGALRIVVQSRGDSEKERDRELALTLWSRILKHGEDEEARLSAQQRQVYRLLQQGRTYKEIAGALGVAHSTVRVQVATIRKQLGASQVPLLRKNKPKLI